MSSVEWRHDIDLPGEGRTVGFYDPALDLDRTGVPALLDGERVLDVGCSDGGHTFLCEQRGASVLGIDDQSSPRNEGRNNFAYTKERIGASAEYRQGRTGDLVAASEPPFDRILHFNVLYHVEDLIGEARNLHALLRPGGTLHLKTKFLTDLPARATSRVPTDIWLKQRSGSRSLTTSEPRFVVLWVIRSRSWRTAPPTSESRMPSKLLDRLEQKSVRFHDRFRIPEKIVSEESVGNRNTVKRDNDRIGDQQADRRFPEQTRTEQRQHRCGQTRQQDN